MASFATAWTATPAFQNSWANYGSGNPDAAYRVDGQGMVHLTGYISGGASGNAAFTMPAGLRPAGPRSYPGAVSGSIIGVIVVVASNGTVTLYFTGSTTAFCLDGVSYLAEQ